MASLTITSMQVFPPGTTVGAYPLSGWMQSQLPPSGAPPVAATTTGVMGDTGVTLTGLADSVRYVIGGQVGGVWRFMSANTLHDAVDLPSTGGNDGDVVVRDSSVAGGLSFVSMGDPWEDQVKPAGTIRESLRGGRSGSALSNLANVVTLGTPTLCLVPALASEIFTAAEWFLGSTGLAANSATNMWAFLADLNLRVVVVSAPGDVTAAWTANTSRTFTYTSPYTAPSDAPLYRGLLIAGGATTPSLIGISANSNAPYNKAPVSDGKSSTTGLTTPVAVGTVLGAVSSTGNGRPYMLDK